MECIAPITVGSGGTYKKMRIGLVVHKPFVYRQVPCGKCAFCLTNKRAQWMFRIHHEMKNQMQPGYFLTLTYSEKYVQRVPGVGLSLRFRDVQLFLKQIRKAKYYAKYICVGEYGSQTRRPHYHMLIWTDCPTEKLDSLWFRGSIHYGQLTMASAMYTLKYIIQPKQQATPELEKTRAQFSKGLGISYLDRSTCEYHCQCEDDPNFFSVIDGAKVALPRYYKDKIFTRHQKKIGAWKWSLEKHKKERILFRTLRDQGIRNPRVYLKSLLVIQAQRIIEKTKFNQYV